MPTDIQLSVEFGVSVLQKIVDVGYDFLQTEHKKRDLLGKATKRYVEGLIERFGEVKVLGMNKPVPLLSLYVRANILEKISARAGAKVEELEAFFDFDRRAFGEKVETKDGEAIANELQRFIVLGKPGAGKTTFLKYLALAMVYKQSIIKRRRLPIFVTLRDWADKKCSLVEYIVEQFDICNFKQAGLFVENLLRQGECLVLFDGLDEVGQEANLDGIIRAIRDFSDKYSGNQFVMSCRVAAYNHWFERFTDVEMSDFNEEQIEQFVRNWFRSEPKTGEECLKHLKGSPQLKELASVPLLLTLLCISYDDNNEFPSNRAELYKDAVEALLRKWDSSRRIRRDDPYKQLSLMQKENMFARIAFGTFKENRYFIREADLAKMIGNFIGNLSAFKQENLEVDSAEVLHTIESHHGIFVERAKHIHSFAHLTFQEYFTAKYIVDKGYPELEKLVQEHLYDGKWKEVFLLVAGMLPDADELLLMMLKKNRELLCEPELNRLVDTASKMLLPVDSKYLTESRKAIALYMILHLARVIDFARDTVLDRTLRRARGCALDLDRALDRGAFTLDLDRALDSGAFALASALVYDFDPAHDPAFDLDRALDIDISFAFGFERSIDIARVRDRARVRAFNNAYTRASDRALDINRALDIDLYKNISLNIQIADKINLFLESNLLIALCLNSAAYLSKSTREYVRKEMISPLEPLD